MLAMTVLSVGPVWRYVYDLGLPILNSQRVPARFILLPVTACTILAALSMQRYIAKAPAVVKWLLAATLVPLAVGFYNHSTVWTVRELEVLTWDPIRSFLPVSLIAPDMAQASTRLYVHTLWASSAFSASAGLCWVYMTVRARNEERRTKNED
jgi:hypothetical protein